MQTEHGRSSGGRADGAGANSRAPQSHTFHTGDVDALLTRIAADGARGLTASEAAARLERDGRNELPSGTPPSVFVQFLKQFANPIVLTLLFAAVIAAVNGTARGAEESFFTRYADALAIGLIVVLNAALGFYQERKAEAALDALKQLQTPSARVRRDDQVLTIPAGEVVTGDLLEIEAGDAVPADARLLQSYNLATQEGTLTGESAPVGKDARAELGQATSIGDRINMLFVGTTVVRGRARAVVVATGTGTELGRLSALMAQPAETKTPLEERLDHFGTRVLWACLATSGLLFGWGMIKHEREWHDLLLEAVSLAVAAIPEGLPAITTITLALGMQRMARRGAILRKLAAVETLGAATVICSDKTGTLTQNEMTVREVYADGVRYGVTGAGYDPRGEVLSSDGQPVVSPSGGLANLLATVALCNNASLVQDESGWRVTGDPTEGALLTLAAKGGVPRESIVPSHQVLHELPFDSDRKRMTIVTRDQFGQEVVHTKGSADILLPLCTNRRIGDAEEALDETARREILAVAEEMSGRSLRVLAVARREIATRASQPPSSGSDVENRLTFVGLVGMLDPPREGVTDAVRLCAEAGVRAVMITGDHKLTAIAIAREIGMWEEGATAYTGTELEELTDDALEARVDSARVFARVTAEQKLRIVRAFKAKGHVVAMTGDGVNDAPALREAHIGVAMGKNGTEVARQAADMVLADDNFATVVDAVREGRAIWRNIQKFIFFLLSSNAGLVVTVFVAAFLPNISPLRPLQILWINLVTNGLPALALGIDPPDPTQMRERPRQRSAGLLGARDVFGIAGVGAWMGLTALACYFWPWDHSPDALERARAVAFSLLALSPLFHAFNCRSATASIFQLRPRFPLALLLAVAASALIHLVALVIPSLQPVFETFAMTGQEWLVLIVLSASVVPVIELLKWLERSGLIGRDLGPMSRGP